MGMADAALEQCAGTRGAGAVSAGPRLPADLRVSTWNIHKGVGGDRRRDLRRTASVIAEMAPDVLALQEADTRFGTRTGLLDLDALHRDTGLEPVPVPGVGAAHGWHGNLILTRNAAVEDVHRLSLPGLEPRGALVADLRIEGRPLRVIATHLGLLAASRAIQTRRLLDQIAEMDTRPLLLMGDLNEWRAAGGAALAPLQERFRLPRPVPSFPARYPLLPLDRIMACDQSDLSGLSVHDTELARKASDHRPLTAVLHHGNAAT
jgi:endonuclease/exonuclease/phosphatase family metal-dependent hydrolase